MILAICIYMQLNAHSRASEGTKATSIGWLGMTSPVNLPASDCCIIDVMGLSLPRYVAIYCLCPLATKSA